MSVEIIQQVWPEWKIESEIGRGSYGTVYKAVRDDTDYHVKSYSAIKVISVPGNNSDVGSLMSEGVTVDGSRRYYKEIVDGFVKEIQLMQSFRGMQNIVSVEDYRVVEKPDYIGWYILIRMELLVPFNRFIMNNDMKESDVIRLGIDICTALEYCEKCNIIHRDIKPENIFVNDFGNFKLGDFGIARSLENMSVSMTQKGTLFYMAPEVVRGGEYDARVDIYSLGLVLYRMMNHKRPPFINTEAQMMSPTERNSAIRRRLEGELLPPPTQASRQFSNLILRACAFDPNSRFFNAAEMKYALQSVANNTYKMFSIFTAATVDVSATEFADMKVPEPNGGAYNYRATDYPIEPYEPKPKKNRTLLVLIAILSSVFVVSIGVGAAVLAAKSAQNGYNEQSITDSSSKTTSDESPDSESSAQSSKEQSSEMTPEQSRDAAMKEYLDKADEYLQKKDYSNASAVLAQAEARLGSDSRIDEKRLLIRRKQFSDKLEEFESSGKYLEAIEYMDENRDEWSHWDNSAEYTKWYDSFVDLYRKQILDAAAMLYGDDDIAAAIDKLNDGLKKLPGDEKLTEKLKEYQLALPVSVKALKVTRGESYRYTAQVKDPRGNTYDDVLCLDYEFVGWSMKHGWLELYTGKSYSRFCCTIVPEENFDTGIISDSEGARIIIYGDDKQIYASDPINYRTEGISVELDIQEISYLRIEVVKDANTGLRTPDLTTMLVSPVVYKKPD